MLDKIMLRLNERALLDALANGNFARAEHALASIERREGCTRRVLYNRAVIRMGQRDFAAADALFERQIEEYGENSELLRAAAEAAYLGGDRDRAERRIAAALADPRCHDRVLLERRAAICADAEAHARAMAGKKDFTDGLALLAAHDADGAIAAFRRAADADASDFLALNNLGALLMNHARDYDGAAKAFAKALKLSDQPAMRAHLARARAEAAKR